MAITTDDEARLRRIRLLCAKRDELEKQLKLIIGQINEEIYFIYPENRGESRRQPYGLLRQIVEASGKSPQHIANIRAGKYRVPVKGDSAGTDHT